MIINGNKYCRFMVGQYDIKQQDNWSKYVRNKFGEDIDPYWTTEKNFYNDNQIVDVLYIREDVRFKD